jgi:isoleucyl-tRNA synthetase
MLSSLPDKPDHPRLELDVLDLWEREKTFDAVRAKNAGGPTFSFIDGPVTANKTLGVHTSWGRTLKDVFQRYKALQGFHQRYQNGFDCQGLWIEVGVEKKLGLNSKPEIEAFGLAEFARECRAVVAWSVGELTRGSIRLGMWMDWGNDYLTSADGNIEYIWRFLKTVNERGWLYQGHRSTEWCPRCGTSISTHELIGSYVDLESPSVRIRLPLLDRPDQYLVIWTTTPWTLPANVAAAVAPDADYGLTEAGDWVATASSPQTTFTQVVKGRDLEGLAYRLPFADLPAVADLDHRVVLWDKVQFDEGTGIVHIAPGCGTDDFLLGRDLGLAMPTPVDESGHYYDDWGWLAGRDLREVAEDVLDRFRAEDLVAEATTLVHRYPECWRCQTPLIYRISNDWFISVDEIRQAMRHANATVEWTPSYMGKRMDDWLVNMSDWNISRRRYYGLPLPFYACSNGHLTVVGSKAELAELAVTSLDGLEELRRPWIDDVRIACRECGVPTQRIAEVGDVWLDAGIVPFSTLGWQNPTAVPRGMATGAAAGLTQAELPDHAEWERWFPADWVSEMREQIRLWFYSQLFISVALVGRAPYRKVLGYEKLVDENGREMHGSWGNMMSADEAFEHLGADVMRWLYCAQPSNQDLPFGLTPGHQVRRKFLTLWNSAQFFVQNTEVNGINPDQLPDLITFAPKDERDAWMVERTSALVGDVTAAYESYASSRAIRAVDEFVADLSNWYIRLSRRRFWTGDVEACQTLHLALVTLMRVMGPITPFLSEYLWQHLVRDQVAGMPTSVFLAGWPAHRAARTSVLERMANTRRVVELGRQGRAEAKRRTRQPLRRAIVEGFGPNDVIASIVRDELRVKVVEFDRVPAAETTVKLNFRSVGKKLGPQLRDVQATLASGEYEVRPDGLVIVAGHELAGEDVLRESSAPAGWGIATDRQVTVALDLALDAELLLEGRANDLVRSINSARRETGLEIADRIRLTLPADNQDLAAYVGMIKAETLAVEVDFAEIDDPHFERVDT